jgi:peptide chain release factor 1
VDPAIPTFTLDERDLKIEWYSGTGAGGQHRNKHQNSCRLTHTPTGTIVTAQCRSRENSYAQAYTDLSKKIVENLQSVYNSGISEDRRQQVGSGMRGDKIRTYRFQDDRVQDHRSMNEASVKKIMNGNFDLLWK